ncbi:MAG: ABC transporter ATP-binding protein [Stellaceae bacterium]
MTQSAVAVEELSLRLGGFALKRVDFALDRGEILVILGPNGAGKSVTLETIAGFHRPDRGRVRIGGRDVTRLAPERRNVGLMFQDFGLFPHLSVAGNVAVGLRAGRARRRLPKGCLAELLERFGIGHLAERGPLELSPGEKQRVALVRALAAEPDLFLFDEPFSALDPQTRDRLRAELERFLRNTGVPAIFVTHDLGDARALADRIVVMREGAVVQRGAAAAIFAAPADRFVAEFVGFDNILLGRIAAGSGAGPTIAIGDQMLGPAPVDFARRSGCAVWLCVRAEDIDVYPAGSAPGAANRLRGRVVAVKQGGMLTRIALDCGFPLRACAMARHLRGLDLAVGAQVEAEIAPGAVHAIPAGDRDTHPDRGV